jgi:hypothetical protein
MNTYFEEIQRSFRSKVPGWDKIPTGDPMKILAEAVARCMESTEERYRGLLDRTLRLSPALYGFRPRPATAAVVELTLNGNSKMKAEQVLAALTVLSFRAGDRKFEASLVEEGVLVPGASLKVKASIVEILTDYQLGALKGENWEEIDLPVGATGSLDRVTLKFPDDTRREITAAAEAVLLTDSSASMDQFFPSASGIVIPFAQALCGSYRAKVQAVAPTLAVAVNPADIPSEEIKFVADKSAKIAEASLGATVSEVVAKESDLEFHRRFQMVQKHALMAFQGSPAVSLEEIQSFIASEFPAAGAPQLSVDMEKETVFVTISQPVSVLEKSRMRRQIEAKIGLRYELVLQTPVVAEEGVGNVH